ncbi:hypothetical protein [Viridibacillus arvi]|uniref:hypothetical protein n=1 Tax=Viridibacillus arvi TaxID=263475 RepID=UPI003D0467C5
MKKENFRPQDLQLALKLHDSIEDLQMEIRIHVSLGNYAAAAICTDEMAASIKGTCELKRAKREHDKMVGISKMMNERGIKVEVVMANA